MSREEIEQKIEVNRERIQMFLCSDQLPLDLIYWNVRRIASQNERLIEKLRTELLKGDKQNG